MAIGIVAEFNPFHNGHKYLIETAKRLNNDQSVICIMSGSFVQRGDIAITDKWTRAKAALKNGADLVIELPVIYSLNTAQKFASGAISTLNALGVCDTLAFGSESGDTNKLFEIAKLLDNEPQEVSDKIKQLMQRGMNYPSARMKAYDGLIDTAVLSSPNDILGIEYIRAAISLKSNMNFCAIERRGVGHDSKNTCENFASASEIRRLIHNGNKADNFIPESAFPIYDPERLNAVLIAKLRTCGAEYLKSINDVSEGIENKFIKAAMLHSTIADVCKEVKSKRYTLSRIRRIAWSALLGITKEAAALSPSYIRILGMNEKGMSILKSMKKSASLPVIVKAADYAGDIIFDINTSAEDIFSLAAPHAKLMHGRQDIITPPVIIKK